MLSKLPEIYLEVLVIIEPSQDGVDVALRYVFVVLDHVSIQLIEIDEAIVPQVQHSETGHSIEISLSLQLFLLFFYFYVVVQLLLY